MQERDEIGSLNPFAMTYDLFKKEMVRHLGLDRYASAEIFTMALKEGRVSPEKLTRLPKRHGIEDDLAKALEIPKPQVGQVREADGVVKFTLRLHDGNEVEAVVLPMLSHYTLCVSSQVGCRRGCYFCTTARMGFKRDLTADEILVQLFTARHVLNYPIQNIVFMGMGEPLDNFKAVRKAIHVMSDQRGYNIPLKRITVSTVGSEEGITRLAASDIASVNLAVSINGATDEVRSKLMPVNRKTPLTRLVEVLKEYPYARKGALFAEYIVIDGVNNSETDAEALVSVMEGLSVHYNLIGFNAGPGAPFESTPQESVEAFRDLLIDRGAYVRIRASKGRDLVAGCGQLGNVSAG